MKQFAFALCMAIFPAFAEASARQVEATSVAFDKDTPAQTKALPAEIKDAPLFHKTMLVLGDEYALNGKGDIKGAWHYRLAEKYHMKYQNISHKWTRLVFDDAPSGGGKSWLHRLNEVKPADYVVLMYGFQDGEYIAGYRKDVHGKIVPHAPEDMERNLALFRKELAKFLEGLKRKAGPKAKIFVVTPHRASSDIVKQVNVAMLEIAPTCGFFVYDMETCLALNPYDKEDKEKYFVSGSKTPYYNDAGNDLILDHIEQYFLDPAKEPVRLESRAGKGKKPRKKRAE